MVNWLHQVPVEDITVKFNLAFHYLLDSRRYSNWWHRLNQLFSRDTEFRFSPPRIKKGSFCFHRVNLWKVSYLMLGYRELLFNHPICMSLLSICLQKKNIQKFSVPHHQKNMLKQHSAKNISQRIIWKKDTLGKIVILL